MSNSALHTCSKTGEAEIDCTACQLAQLCNSSRKGEGRNKLSSQEKAHGAEGTAEDSDDYSISTELTSKGNDYSILYLVLVAFGVFVAVLLFYMITK